MKAPRALGSRLHHAYFLLAAFELITVGGALYLTHRLTSMFEQSLATNKAWQERVRTYYALDEALSDIQSPLNDLFVTAKRDEETQRFSEALSAFDRSRAAARAEAAQAIEGPSNQLLARDFDEIDAGAARMAVATRRVFDSFNPETPEAAAELVPASERAFAVVTAAIAKLQYDAMENGVASLGAQERAATSLRSSETAIGIGIVLMVIAAAVYGRRISIQMHGAAVERESYIERLRASEQAVRQTEERLQLAARATNDALWDWDLQSGAVWWNEAFATLFGHAGASPSLEVWKGLIHPDDRDRVERSLAQFLSTPSDVWTTEYRVRCTDGGYAWILDRGYVLRDPGGAPGRMISSMMNITERKEAERMKSDFVSFVSHQLRTPLSGMSWMLELAADSDGLPKEAREYIADARESAARLSTLVNDLLDIARLESGRLVAVPEPLALSAITESVAAEMLPLAAEKKLALAVSCDPAARRVFADAQLVRQVVTNLVSNALKYTPAGGRVAVSLTQHNDTLTWTVRDTGVGVPRAAQARLFEKFYRAENAITMDAEGTGLGLNLVRLIVEQAGGRVWCESEEGEGATFAFTLPAMATEKG